MRVVFVLAGVLLLAAPARGEPPADVAPWDGVLPVPRGSEPQDDSKPEWFACRILDAETGAPVPGARWIRTPEWIAPHRLRHDAVLGVATADADGVASLPAEAYRWEEECHWVALAPGYAGAYEYGTSPKAEMRLERGEPLRGRVLDAMGDPVAGAVVDVLGGCSHGTAMASVVTAADGSFSFERVPYGGQLWLEGRGFAADLRATSTPDSLGGGEVVLAMDTGHRYEGRVVDLLGKPVEGVVVRAWNEQRGPTALTGRDGRFVLEGAEARISLDFYPPADLLEDDSERDVCDGYADTPMLVVLGPLGVVDERASAGIVVRARGPDGAPAGGVGYRLVSTVTGRGPLGRTEDEEPDEPGELPVGEEREDAAPGTYRVLPEDPFSAFTFDPVEVAASASAPATATLQARPQPRLRIVGTLPPTCDVTLAVPGADETVHADSDDPVHLPAATRAVLRVEAEGRPPFFFPVGPEREGVREVVVALPAPALVAPPEGARDVELLDGRREAYAHASGTALATDARGPLTLRWRAPDETTWEAPVVVPAGGEAVRVDPASARRVRGDVQVRVLRREGERETVHETVDAAAGEALTVEVEGWRTLRVPVPRRPEGDLTVRWGTAAVRVRVVDGEGAPAAATVLADGEVYAAPAGDLTLRGFSAGAVRVVATRPGQRGGVETTVDLREGETVEKTITLP
jgi:hypothetical protein